MKPADLARSIIGAGTAAPPADDPYIRSNFSMRAASDRTYGPSSPPEPAREEELDELRTALRGFQVALLGESNRLAALQQARERAHRKSLAAARAVEDADAVLADAKRHGRAHLVTAYMSGQQISGPSPENAKAMRDVAADNYAHAREVEAALDEEIGRCETDLAEHCRKRDEAAGIFVSASPEFLDLFRRIRAAFAELRSCRIAILSTSTVLRSPLVGRLLDLAQCDEPTDGSAKYVGFAYDDQLIDSWVAAATRLRDDADAPLPGGVLHAPPRQRAGDAKTPRVAQPATDDDV